MSNTILGIHELLRFVIIDLDLTLDYVLCEQCELNKRNCDMYVHAVGNSCTGTFTIEKACINFLNYPLCFEWNIDTVVSSFTLTKIVKMSPKKRSIILCSLSQELVSGGSGAKICGREGSGRCRKKKFLWKAPAWLSPFQMGSNLIFPLSIIYSKMNRCGSLKRSSKYLWSLKSCIVYFSYGRKFAPE